MDQQDKDSKAADEAHKHAMRMVLSGGHYCGEVKHVDEPPLITDAERAALNHKFEYHKAKRLNAAERGTQIHAEIEQALAGIPHAYIVKGDPVPSAKLRAMLDANPQLRFYSEEGVRLDYILVQAPRPSLLRLAISLTVRFLLVLGVAVLVLAMVAK